jgi:hypothetical protein
MEAPDEILDVSRAAARLGISPDGIRKRIQRGTLRGQKIGGTWQVILPAVGRGVGSDTPSSVGQTVSSAQRDETIARLLGIIDRQAATIGELTRRLPELRAGEPGPIGPTPPAPETHVTPAKPRGWLDRLLGR